MEYPFFLKFKRAQSLFSQAMKGYKKKKITVERRQPITPDLMKKLCGATERICFNKYEVILFKAAFSLCFCAASRISKLVPANKKGLSGLLFKAVKVDEKHVKIFLQRSKSDQLGLGICL